MSELTINVDKSENNTIALTAPTDIGLSLLDVLKAYEMPIAGMCRGTAFCATCHVYFTKGFETLPEPSDIEKKILGMLPNSNSNSRLACRLKYAEVKDGCTVQIPAPPSFY